MNNGPENKVQRVLEWYEKEPGDVLIGEELLRGGSCGSGAAALSCRHGIKEEIVTLLQQAILYLRLRGIAPPTYVD